MKWNIKHEVGSAKLLALNLVLAIKFLVVCLEMVGRGRRLYQNGPIPLLHLGRLT